MHLVDRYIYLLPQDVHNLSQCNSFRGCIGIGFRYCFFFFLRSCLIHHQAMGATISLEAGADVRETVEVDVEEGGGG